MYVRYVPKLFLTASAVILQKREKKKQMRNSFLLSLSAYELKKERQNVSPHPHCSLLLLDAYVLHFVCAEEEEGGAESSVNGSIPSCFYSP